MSQANGFSPKRAHKDTVNASILAPRTNKQRALTNLYLQTIFPTLTKSWKTNCPVNKSIISLVSASDN